MRPNPRAFSPRLFFAVKHERGFAMVSALFLVMVIGAAVIYMNRLSLAQQGITVGSVQSERALQAAYSGLDWATYQLNINASCEASSTFTLSEEDLAGFDVTVTCTATSFSEGPDTIVLYALVSSAERGTASDTHTDPGYVFRRLSATIEK